MRMTVYAVQPEEIPVFRRLEQLGSAEFRLTEEKPSLRNLDLLTGVDAVNVISDTVITLELWQAWKERGIRAAVTRTIGMEHMNCQIGESLGIPVFNITYSPASVADYAIMMMLMVLRHVKPMMYRYLGQDYTMTGYLGRELPNMTVGILGAGRIGTTVLKHLRGFGCRLLYWNRSTRPELETLAESVPLDTLLQQSDILSVHLAANSETEGFLNRERIGAMKHGAVLINTARGPIVDTEALIEALETCHLSAAGLDVFDGDRSIYYRDYKNKTVHSQQKAILDAMPNVLMLPHMAYYTDQAMEDMVCNSVKAVADYFQNSCRKE